MSKSRKSVVSLLIIGSGLLLCMMLLYPRGYDQSVFTAGARMIANDGALPYKDFIDTKPPLIFYMYYVSGALFNFSEMSIRIFDIIYQSITLLILYKTVFRASSNKLMAALSIFTYALLYSTSGYWMTAQSESFSGLPILLIIYSLLKLEFKEYSRYQLVVAGFVVGVCLFGLLQLKYTLIVVSGAVACYFLFSSPIAPKKKRLFLLGVATSLFVFLGGYLLILAKLNSLDDLLLSIDWVRGYANITPLFSLDTIRSQYYLAFPSNLISSYSPIITLLMVGGIYAFLSEETTSSPNTRVLNRILLWMLVFSYFGILYERKCMTYHYARTFIIISPFVAQSFLRLFNYTREKITTTSSYVGLKWVKSKILLIVFGLIALFYSPATRLISHPLYWTSIGITNNEDARLKRLDFDKYWGTERIKLSNYLSSRLSESDNIFVWGHFVELYNILNKTPKTICLTNTPLITAWTPIVWKERLLLQLKRISPKYFIVQRNDVFPYINGRSVDSYQMLLEWRELSSFLFSGYAMTLNTVDFVVYERI